MSTPLAFARVVPCWLIGLGVFFALLSARVAHAAPSTCATTCEAVEHVLDRPGMMDEDAGFDAAPLTADCEKQCERFTEACGEHPCDLSVGAPPIYRVHGLDAGTHDDGGGLPDGDAGTEEAGFETIARTCDGLFQGETLGAFLTRAKRAEIIQKCMDGWVSTLVVLSNGSRSPFAPLGPRPPRPLSPDERAALVEDGQASPAVSAVSIWGLLPLLALAGLVVSAIRVARMIRALRAVRALVRRGADVVAGRDGIISGTVITVEDSPPSFTLRDAEGRSIRVIRGDHAWSKLGPKVDVDGVVHAFGHLVLGASPAASYRDDGRGLSLEPTEDRQLRWSTTSFLTRAARLARLHACLWVLQAALLGASGWGLFHDFAVLGARGQVVEAAWSRALEGSTQEILLTAPDLVARRARVDPGWGVRLFGEGHPDSTLPCIAIDGRLAQLGTKPSIELSPLALAFGIAIVLLIFGAGSALVPLGADGFVKGEERALGEGDEDR